MLSLSEDTKLSVKWLKPCVLCTSSACDCVVYQSYGLSSGRFTSPNFPQFYPPVNCVLYTFIGDSNEIVELTFIEFDLEMPDVSG